MFLVRPEWLPTHKVVMVQGLETDRPPVPPLDLRHRDENRGGIAQVPGYQRYGRRQAKGP